MNISISNPSKKRALFIIDIQAGFVTPENKWIIPNVQRLIKDGGYEFFIEANFHADPGSQWDVQSEWTFPLSPTIPEIKSLLDPAKTHLIIKTQRSVFDADKNLVKLLREKGIEEVHVVGFDINDCVLMTANHAFDFGFFSYVIEECAESSQTPQLRDAALAILRENEMII